MFITSQNSLSCFIFIVLKKTNKDKQTNETWQCAFRDSPALPFPLLPGPTLYFIVFSMSFRFWFRFRQFLPGMGPRQLRAHWCGTGPAPLDGPQRLPCSPSPPPQHGQTLPSSTCCSWSGAPPFLQIPVDYLGGFLFPRISSFFFPLPHECW